MVNSVGVDLAIILQLTVQKYNFYIKIYFLYFCSRLFLYVIFIAIFINFILFGFSVHKTAIC